MPFIREQLYSIREASRMLKVDFRPLWYQLSLEHLPRPSVKRGKRLYYDPKGIQQLRNALNSINA